MTNVKFEVEKFDGKNDFNIWREKMNAHLGILGLDEALKGEAKMSSSLSDKERAEMAKKARNTIILSLGDQILRKVIKETTAAGMWAKLEQLYMTKSLPNRIYLKQKFYGFKMDESLSIDDNIDVFTKLISDLETLDIEIDDEDQAIFLLNSLPKAYDHLRDTLKYGRETLSLEEVVSAAYSKELDLKAHGKGSRATAEGLNVRGRTEKRESKGRAKSRSRSKSKFRKGKCHHCKEPGHYIRECPKRKKESDKTIEANTSDSANLSQELSEDEVLTVSPNDPRDQWILDSGCTYHMTPRRDWFLEYESLEGGTVLMGNNMSCNVVGIGKVRLRMWDGSVKVLENVRHIPDLKRNLISLGMLDTKGYSYKSQGGMLKVIKGIIVVMKGLLKQGLYVLEGATVVGESAVSLEKENVMKLWHKRLGHMSMKGMVELCKQGVLGVKNL